MMHAILATMTSSLGTEVAEALGLLLKRSTRARIYGDLTWDLDPAIDEATYPVVSGLARLGPRSAAQLAVELGIDRSVVSRHATRLELTARGAGFVEVMRKRLSDILDAYLATWPPEKAAEFTAGFRRFVTDGPFHP
jgi:hypothetical protein